MSTIQRRRCPMCSRTFTPSGLVCHRSCPLGSHCKLICCPHCGYQMPDESQSVLAKAWAHLWALRHRPLATHAATPESCPLDRLPAGVPATICSFGALSRQHLARCSALGLTPGAAVQLLQRHPTPIIRVGEAEIAIGVELAAQIRVQPEGAAL